MAEKIYEFDLVDKYNTPESDILRTVEQSLVAEAELQGWEPGYSVQQSSMPRENTPGIKEYQFTVFGHFMADSGDERNLQKANGEIGANSTAAKSADL